MAKNRVKNKITFLKPDRSPLAPPAETCQVSTQNLFYTVFIFIILCTNCLAQTNALVLTNFTHNNTIYLRWAPSTLPLFEQALNNGYTLEKINLDSYPNFSADQFETMPKQRLVFKPVKTVLDSLKKAKSPRQKNYVLIEPFVSANANVKLKKMAFAYCLINAGYTKTLAQDLSLAYQEPEKAKFAYRISITGSTTKSDVIMASAILNSTNKAITLDTVIGYKKSAMLTWEAKTLESDFAAYFVERSTDGVNFKQLTALPMAFMASQYEKDKTHCTYLDTTVEYGQPYVYRIQGVNHFGLETTVSNTQKVYIKNKFSPLVTIDTIRCKGSVKLIYPTLAFENEKEKLFCAKLLLLVSKNPVQFYKTVAQSKLLDFTGFCFTDTVNRNYVHYKIAAVSIDGDTIFSLPQYFFFNDSIPPTIPVNLNGNINDKGIVSLSWKNNTETDLRGYKIYVANNLNEDFVEKTLNFCLPNHFTDTIGLNNLDSVIYYKVQAVDTNFNHSARSEPLRLVKPDKIAPIPAVFKTLVSTKKGIVMHWNNSTSADIKFTQLYRIENRNEIVLKEFRNNDTASFFYDSTVVPNVNYRYKLMVIDRSGNKAFNQSNFQSYEPGYRPMIKKIRGKADLVQKYISLEWEFLNEPVYSYRIYRSKNNEPNILLKTLNGKNRNYIDNEIYQNNVYTYQLEAILMSGIHTQMSLPVVVEY